MQAEAWLETKPPVIAQTQRRDAVLNAVETNNDTRARENALKP